MLGSHTATEHCVLGMKKTFSAVKTMFPFHVTGRRHMSEIILNCLVAHKFGYIQVWCVFNFVENRIY